MRIAVVLLLAALLQEEKPQTGPYQAAFTERHPQSGLKDVCKRMGWGVADVKKGDPDVEKFKLEDESYEVFVPASYAADKPAGLLVWISPGAVGTVDSGWREVLEKYNVIAIGANKSGNTRGVYFRMALALDAVHNMGKKYTIDRKRIYVSGFSGGGRSASRCAMGFPDVFTGGIYMCGMDYFKNIPDPDDAKKVFAASFPKPEGDLLKKLKKESRHVILNGATDMNLPASKATGEAMKKQDQFSYVFLLEMPGKDHEAADGEWLGKAIEALDAPLKEEKPKK